MPDARPRRKTATTRGSTTGASTTKALPLRAATTRRSASSGAAKRAAATRASPRRRSAANGSAGPVAVRKAHQTAAEALADLRSAYAIVDTGGDYPPLRLRSLAGRVSRAEWQARVDCACAYRLVAHFGMDDLIYNHISARIPGTEQFLLNAMGLTYDEITASSLIKVDLEGNVLWSPTFPKGLPYKFNPAGFVIHSAIHRARPAVGCIIHTHSLATMAVGSLEQGLLPMTQTAMRFARVAYHDYEGVVLTLDEQVRLLENMGDAEVMLLRNHGVLAVGGTVAEAFNNVYRIERACRTQLMAMACNDRILLPPPAVVERTNEQYNPGTRRPYGLLEWPAMRRLADRIDPAYRV